MHQLSLTIHPSHGAASGFGHATAGVGLKLETASPAKPTRRIWDSCHRLGRHYALPVGDTDPNKAPPTSTFLNKSHFNTVDSRFFFFFSNYVMLDYHVMYKVCHHVILYYHVKYESGMIEK